MPPILRSILAVVIGWIVGSAVNMGLVSVGHSVYPLEGVDINDMEALAAAMPNFTAEQFIFPFLAHALGTLVGAAVAALIASRHRMRVALIVGAIFFVGGIVVNFMLPAPTWFKALDIILAYLPMAWIGGRIGLSLRPDTSEV